MALAAPILAASSPAHRTGTAAVVAPTDVGDQYVSGLGRPVVPWATQMLIIE
ncbi:hypothetical protein [Streptomyces collinus]|uniref:hypothetical protein n=1 Tax=Streptomyces collinus TaxID=42684 RepID=UPI0036825451